MEMFKSNDSLQLAYICAPAGLHASLESVPNARTIIFLDIWCHAARNN